MQIWLRLETPWPAPAELLPVTGDRPPSVHQPPKESPVRVVVAVADADSGRRYCSRFSADNTPEVSRHIPKMAGVAAILGSIYWLNGHFMVAVTILALKTIACEE
jgi:hypothetical protein